MSSSVRAFLGNPPPEPRVRHYVLAIAGTVGLFYCMAALFFGMRMVMDVGGYCASGGSAYVIEQQCPEGSVLLVAPSIPVGFLFGAMMAYGFSGFSGGAAGLVLLFWPVLFLSLGWNFFEGAFNPPGDGGLDVGWLICGIVFWLMGAPAAYFAPKLFKGLGPRRPVILAIFFGGAVAGALLAKWLADTIA